jgi:hypothetical protein
MSIAELAQNVVARLADWWRDREDERLDELVGQDFRHVSDEAAQSGVTAYRLVSRARGSKSG